MISLFLVKTCSVVFMCCLPYRASCRARRREGFQSSRKEEAPSLGKPVLVMRETTERPEAVEARTVRLVGSSTASIVENVNDLLTHAGHYEAMAKAHNPYGDGKACERIVAVFS